MHATWSTGRLADASLGGTVHWLAIRCIDMLPGAFASYQIHRYAAWSTGKLTDASLGGTVNWKPSDASMICSLVRALGTSCH